MADEAPKKKVKKDNSLSAAAAQLGRAGGKVGGVKRAESLTAEERSKIAAEGGRARARKAKKKKGS